MNWPPGYPPDSRNILFTPLVYMAMGGQFHSLTDAYKEPAVPHAKTPAEIFSNDYDNDQNNDALVLTKNVLHHVERFGGILLMSNNKTLFGKYLKTTAKDFLLARGWKVRFTDVDLDIVVLRFDQPNKDSTISIIILIGSPCKSSNSSPDINISFEVLKQCVMECEIVRHLICLFRGQDPAIFRN